MWCSFLIQLQFSGFNLGFTAPKLSGEVLFQRLMVELPTLVVIFLVLLVDKTSGSGLSCYDPLPLSSSSFFAGSAQNCPVEWALTNRSGTWFRYRTTLGQNSSFSADSFFIWEDDLCQPSGTETPVSYYSSNTSSVYTLLVLANRTGWIRLTQGSVPQNVSLIINCQTSLCAARTLPVGSGFQSFPRLR